MGRTACITVRTSSAMSRTLAGSGPMTRKATGNGEGGPNTNLGHAHARLRRETIGHSLAQAKLERFSLLGVLGQYDNLGEGRIG